MALKPIRIPRAGRPLVKPRTVKLPKVKPPKVKVGGIENFAKSPEAVGAAIGAGVLFGIQAMANRKGKDGLSAQQRTMRERERHITSDLEAKEREGRGLGFSDKVKKITARPYSQLADLATEYPVRSALRMGMAGAAGGATIARILTKTATGPTLPGVPAPPKPQMPKMTGAGAMQKPPGIPALPGMPKMAQERLALADEWGRELAKEAFAGSQMVGQAMRGVLRSRWGGAGIGAAAGAARYAMSDDPNKSFVGSVGGGALAGGMAHQLAKGGLSMALKDRGSVGAFSRDSLRQGNKAARMPKTPAPTKPAAGAAAPPAAPAVQPSPAATPPTTPPPATPAAAGPTRSPGVPPTPPVAPLQPPDPRQAPLPSAPPAGQSAGPYDPAKVPLKPGGTPTTTQQRQHELEKARRAGGGQQLSLKLASVRLESMRYRSLSRLMGDM
jgi:hypothetical protein